MVQYLGSIADHFGLFLGPLGGLLGPLGLEGAALHGAPIHPMIQRPQNQKDSQDSP